MSLRERQKEKTMKCEECGVELPLLANCESHLLHTDAEYKAAWDLTGGRFQIFAYTGDRNLDNDEAFVDTRSRFIFRGARKDVETVVPVIQRWLDEQSKKER